MSNFPFNSHRYSPPGEVNGCPINYREAYHLADTVRWWHGEIIGTDSWSQSNDGAEADTVYIALGLMELLSDPGAVKRLAMTGKSVKTSVDNLMKIETESDFFDRAREVVRPLFDRSDRGL